MLGLKRIQDNLFLNSTIYSSVLGVELLYVYSSSILGIAGNVEVVICDPGYILLVQYDDDKRNKRNKRNSRNSELVYIR